MSAFSPFNRLLKVAALFAWSVCAWIIVDARAATTSVRKVEIEVVSTFKIIKLCEWDVGYDERLTIGVYDSSEYLEFFYSSAKSVVAKQLFNVPITIVSLDAESAPDAFIECDVIFFDNKKRKAVEGLVEKLGNSPILLVGSSKDFLESGGMVRFSYSNDQLLFGINERKGIECGIRFRSSLLALASEVVR